MREQTTKEIEQDKRLLSKMADIKNKLVVISGKGGVGKSTVAVNLAYKLAVNGHSVGILDVDIHGPNIAKMLGVEGKKPEVSDAGIEPVEVLPNLKAMSTSFFIEDQDQPIIWRGPLKMVTIKQLLSDTNWGSLDYLIIDSPPGTGDEPLSVCQLIPAVTGAIVVTTPQDVAVMDARKSVLFAKNLQVNVVGIIENMSGMSCPHCGKEIDWFGSGGGEKSAGDFNVPFLGKIPVDPAMVKHGDAGKPFIHFKSENQTAKIMNEIVGKIELFIKNNG
ncbi:MAG: Mrp/NBP35 family ATP-binding protein [Candidatus Ancaeobacter aquaticus]|nr:Mrp/NBP35 family ATP-binding protein [Candidatus Ancaeobacter aquaticus]